MRPSRAIPLLVALVAALTPPAVAQANAAAVNPAAKSIAMAAVLPYDVVSIHQNKSEGNWSFQTTDDGLIAKKLPVARSPHPVRVQP